MLDFPAFLSESLEVLCLNDNHLEAVPPSVCQLKSLSELYLGKYVHSGSVRRPFKKVLLKLSADSGLLCTKELP